ncbi:MAG: epimerase [Rhodobacteraceae bacterium]|nr:epimerase [Paracoccaceae bacterium]
MTNTVLVLGASGSFGRNCVEAFSKAGWSVRKYRRDVDDITVVSQGVDVIVNGLNPQNYKNWPVELPRITKLVVGAAISSGATILQPGNVYNYGNHAGDWNEDTPHLAQTIKGKVRIEMEKILYDATQKNGIQVIILRGGDYIDKDPSGNFIDFLGAKIGKGKFSYPGNPDIPHAWAYLPDMARAAVMLAEIRTTLAQFEDVIFDGLTISGNDLTGLLQKVSGKNLTLTKFPWWLMKLLSPVWVLARELQEMRYLWNTPHSLDGAKLARLIPDFKPSKPEQMMTGIVAQ